MKIKRLVDGQHVSDIVALLHQAYAADEQLGIHFSAASITEAAVASHIQTTPTFVLTVDQQIAATVSVRLPWSDNPGPYHLPHLGWIATAPQFQHRGYAKRLIATVIHDYVIRELAAPAVSLGTAVEHPWLQQTYQTLGFKPIETIRKFTDHQTIYLVKSLTASEFVPVGRN